MSGTTSVRPYHFRGIEHHLMGLKRLGPRSQSAAVLQPGMRNLRMDLFTSDYRSILALVELGLLTRCEDT